MRVDYPATQRNREPILSVLRSVLPVRGTVLEIASGTGQHTAAFAPEFPDLVFQPTDLEPHLLASIEAYTSELPNVVAPLQLDVRQPWGVSTVDAIVCINMIHIAPWECAEALLEGAARRLPAGGPLYLYGPFKVGGVHTAPSNAAFDESLRARDPAWGVRELEAVVDRAARVGLRHERSVDMPANNLSLVFRLG